MGIAKKNGIDLTKKTVASSREANITYIAKATARYGTIERGKIPVTIKPNKISWTTNIQSITLNFGIDFIKFICYYLVRTLILRRNRRSFLKIVRTARSFGTVIRRIIKCSCTCEFEVVSSELDNFKVISDWRDGDYYKIPCPECRAVNNVNTSLFR